MSQKGNLPDFAFKCLLFPKKVLHADLAALRDHKIYIFKIKVFLAVLLDINIYIAHFFPPLSIPFSLIILGAINQQQAVYSI